MQTFFGKYLAMEMKKVKNKYKLKRQGFIFDAQSDDTNADARQNVSDQRVPNYNRPYQTNSHMSAFRSYEIERQFIDDSGSSGRSTTSNPYPNTFTLTQM